MQIKKLLSTVPFIFSLSFAGHVYAGDLDYTKFELSRSSGDEDGRYQGTEFRLKHVAPTPSGSAVALMLSVEDHEHIFNVLGGNFDSTGKTYEFGIGSAIKNKNGGTRTLMIGVKRTVHDIEGTLCKFENVFVQAEIGSDELMFGVRVDTPPPPLVEAETRYWTLGFSMSGEMSYTEYLSGYAEFGIESQYGDGDSRNGSDVEVGLLYSAKNISLSLGGHVHLDYDDVNNYGVVKLGLKYSL